MQGIVQLEYFDAETRRRIAVPPGGGITADGRDALAESTASSRRISETLVELRNIVEEMAVADESRRPALFYTASHIIERLTSAEEVSKNPPYIREKLGYLKSDLASLAHLDEGTGHMDADYASRARGQLDRLAMGAAFDVDEFWTAK